MDLYHSWFYVHILNTTWFVRSIVFSIFILNLLLPVILWRLFNGKPMMSFGGRKQKQQTPDENDTKQEVS